MISLEQFIKQNTGKHVGVPWNKELDGECVSLIQQYISQCLNQPMRPRGNAKDWEKTYINESLGYITDNLKKGDILVWNGNYGNGYGHLAIYCENNQIFEQNNPWGSSAHLGNLFGDYTILRPNNELSNNYIGTPVARDTYKDQLQVNVYNLVCRKNPSLVATKLGWINEGIYNILNIAESDGYIWYEIEQNKWIPNKDNWCTILAREESPISEVTELKKEIEKLKEQISNLQLANNNLTEALDRFNTYQKFTALLDGLYYINLAKDDVVIYKV